MVQNDNNVMISKDEYMRLTDEAIKLCSETDPDMPLQIKLMLTITRNEILTYLGFLLFEKEGEQ